MTALDNATNRKVTRLVARCITDSALAADLEHAQSHLLDVDRQLTEVTRVLKHAATTLTALAARLHAESNRDAQDDGW